MTALVEMNAEQASAAARRAIRRADVLIEEMIALVDVMNGVEGEPEMDDEMSVAVIMRAAQGRGDDVRLTTFATAVLRLSQARKSDSGS